jgi:hypothetical protein
MFDFPPTTNTSAGDPTSASVPQPTAWAQVDAPAATPRSVAAQSTIAAPRPIQLRRSRNHVLSSLDDGGKMLQRRGRDLLVGSSLLLLPVVALNLWATTLAFDRGGSTTLTAFGGDDVGTGIDDVAAVLAVVCASFAAAVIGCFTSAVLFSERFGAPVGLWPAIQSTVRRLPVVFVAWAIGHLWVPFFATWALASRSDDVVGRLFVVIPIGALFSTATLYAIPVMVAERTGPLRALQRSWRLVRTRSVASLGFICSSALLGSLLFAGITFLPALVESGGFVTFGSYTWLAQGITGQLGVIVVVPLVALATAEMYLAVRLDAEGLDIALDADAAFGPWETS